MKNLSLMVALVFGACGEKNVPLEPPAATQPEVESSPSLAGLHIPGPPELAEIGRRIIAAKLRLAPYVAAESGLMDDAIEVPDYSQATVSELVEQLNVDLEALRALPFAALTVDEQIDVRWLVANAEEMVHQLTVERRWEHRPSEWLEPVAYTLVAMVGYAPQRPELQVQIAAKIPAMIEQMRELVVQPTRRDVQTAAEILAGLVQMLEALPAGPERAAAVTAARAYEAHLATLTDLPEFRVIGPEAYAWRLEHAMLLPWSPDELLQVAEEELARVDSALAAFGEWGEPQPPSASERAAAEALDAEGLLAIYDGLVEENLASLRAMDVVTVSADLPALKARPTPPPLIPLTGDGGSMSPPPLFGEQTVGWWNVENFSDDWSMDRRLEVVVNANRSKETWFGPYAVHEGVPGHHLQLAEVRANPNPLRTILWDNATVEGWGLYAEELFWEHGGFGDAPQAHRAMLGSYRYRIRRVVYDTKVATGRWTLQEAAAWKSGQPDAEPGPDILRTINWPTQLIGYFAGKKQMVDLREEIRARQGAEYSEREFNDAILHAGLIPMPLIRAQMLGEPIEAP